MTWTETARTAAKNAIAGDIAVHDRAVLPIIREKMEAGLSLRKIAELLGERGIPSPGNRNRATRFRDHWTPAAVLRICRRNGIGRGREKPDTPPVCTPHTLYIPHFDADMKRSSSAQSHLSLLTPERWERARQVLHGENPHGVSTYAAALAAGVPRPTLLAWIRRACERRHGDDPLLATVAQDYEERHDLQADVLEDALWARAMNGMPKGVYHKGKLATTERRYDNKLAMDLLAKRDPAYGKNRKQGSDEPTEKLTPEELFNRMRNAARVHQARQEYLKQAAEHGLLPPGMVVNGKAKLVDEKEKKEGPAEPPPSAFVDVDNDYENLDL